ncbi:unnamed protein product [Soboliphyme baturini]|uniref:LAM_G_DOMAIN domain-containing protein n=1 Tax=Soboliphyme baturini TaxID=241478 RepID=A0A183J390_9BILA|nr:unnamed protein product [Soboliphyme baturini]
MRLEVSTDTGDSGVHQQLIRESSNYLSAIETTDLSTADNFSKDGFAKAEEVLKKVDEFESQLKFLFNRSTDLSDIIENFQKNLFELSTTLNKSLRHVADANETLDRLVEVPFYSTLPEFGVLPIEKTLNEASQIVFNASKMLSNAEKTVQEMRISFDAINQTDFSLENSTTSISDVIDELLDAKSACSERAKYLIEEAEKLEVQLAGTRITATDAVSAANAYKSMKKALESAEIAGTRMLETQHALTSTTNLSSIAEDVLESRRTAVGSLRQASDIRRNITNDLRNSLRAGIADINTQDSFLSESQLVVKNFFDRVDDLESRVLQVKVGANFFNNSSLHLRNPDNINRIATQSLISLFFNTEEPNGLLFFVGNEKGTASKLKALPSDDYLALEVNEGKVKLIYDLGTGETIVFGSQFVADSRWHQVTVERIGKLATLTITTEGQKDDKTEVFSRGSTSILNLIQNASKIFVGGVPSSVQLPDGVSNRHFVGKIEDLIFHGEYRALWNFELDGLKNVKGARERDELKTVSATSGVSLTGNGYIIMKRDLWNPREETTVVLHFKTFSSTGLIFFIGKDRDYFAIELKNGQVRLHFNLGSGAAVLVTPRRYNDGAVHRVLAQRTSKEAKLIVDMWETIEGMSPGDMAHLDVTDEYYVGGLPNIPAFENVPVIRQGFYGCIDRMQINGNAVNLNKNVKAVFVEQNCPDKPKRVVSFDRPGGSVKFTGIGLNLEVEVTFKFRTNLKNTWLLLINDDNASEFSRAVSMVQISNKDFGDGLWHYVTGSKHEHLMKLDVDDAYSESVELNSLMLYAQTEGTMHFGSVPATDSSLLGLSSFVGCIGDVTYNGRLLNFADAARYGEYVSFDGCSDDLFPAAITDETSADLLPDEQVQPTTHSSMMFTTVGRHSFVIKPFFVCLISKKILNLRHNLEVCSLTAI